MGWKTLGEKEKLLVTSNFCFSHNIFHSYISLVRQNELFCTNGLNHFCREAHKFTSFLVIGLDPLNSKDVYNYSYSYQKLLSNLFVNHLPHNKLF